MTMGPMLRVLCVVLTVGITSVAGSQPTKDTSKHNISKITTQPGITLEVLDWGGTGQTIVLLAGLGNDAHIFDGFAERLAAKYHVIGITRRGFGDSTLPVPDGRNYAPDVLGDDILSVLTQLKLERPILLGHSIAGEELSDIGTRFPDRVRAPIYMEAGYAYAYDDPAHPDFSLTLNKARNELNAITFATPPSQLGPQMLHLADVTLPQLQRLMEEKGKRQATLKDPPPLPTPPLYMDAVLNEATGFGPVHCPVLAIYAMPSKTNLSRRSIEDQADAFAIAMPQAHVVRMEKAQHYIFKSNATEVLREIDAYISGLDPA